MGGKDINMLPSSMVHLLWEERQHELITEAEQSRRIKEAEANQNQPPARQLTARVWLGERLISWGTRLQAGSYYNIPGARKSYE
jgi:hypothetical protein